MKEIQFKSISPEDKEIIESFLLKYPSLCTVSTSFTGMISWEVVYHSQWAIIDDTLLFKLINVTDKREHFMQPIGKFPKVLQKKLLDYAQNLSYKLKIFGISKEFIVRFSDFISNFELRQLRELDHYIYAAEDIAHLKGRNYQAKRNLINQFETNYQWTSEPITSENIQDCIDLVKIIYPPEALDTHSFLPYELKALDYVLQNFQLLNEEGILIRVDGKVVAFSIFEPINPSTSIVHFEKAIKEYKGLYQLINRETSLKILSKGCSFINREEDMGIEGLRKAKLSYHPIELYPAKALAYIKLPAQMKHCWMPEYLKELHKIKKASKV